jgi:RHS repeat-associated protein
MGHSLASANALRLAFLFVAILLAAQAASGQVATGTPPFGSFSGGPDIVNNANLNAHLQVPVLAKAGRGLPFHYTLSYDSSVWYPSSASGTNTWTPLSNWGWMYITSAALGEVTYKWSQGSCFDKLGNIYYYDIYSNWVYYDPLSAPHPLAGSWEVSDKTVVAPKCTTGGPPYSTQATVSDGSGYTLAVSAAPAATAYSRSGHIVSAPLQSNSGSGSHTDTNGNYFNGTSSGFTDTLDTSAVSISGSGTPSSPITYTYTAASGNQASVTVDYTSYTVQTNFGCSGITEYAATAQNLVSSITLPDGTSYSFTYEVTPGDSHNPHYVTGRPASVTLPTGGTISYGYSGGSNGITCADGSAATLARTTPDGTWTYAHSESGSAWATTLTDPQSNVTTFNFQAVAVASVEYGYETERQVASLETVYTCYQGASFPCNSTAVALPLSQRTVTTSIGGLESQVNTDYNSYGLPTEVDEYGYGSGAVGSLVRKTTTAYNTSLTNNIYDRPATISVYNSSGTLLRQASYSYDGSSLTSTSGTPQHSNPSGSRGNLTGLALSGSGFNNISKSTTFYDTGGAYVLTDFNGAQTTHNSGTGACGNSFDTTISFPLSLSESLAWNCNGAVKTSVTDLNSNATSFSYDNMNRLIETSYPDGGLSKIQYTSATVDDFCSLISGSVTSFCTPGSGSLARHDETLLDGLGRTIHQDLVSDPSGETYVDTTYDSLGRLYTRSNPYRSTSDPTYGKDTYSYDALNRVTKITHADSSYSQISYGSGTQACSASTYGYGYSALYTDESGNQRQTFTDGLGRVIEVDEPNPGSGNSLTWNTCHAYDAQGDLTSVVQGSETRSYSYDGLSRLTQQTTPEGATTYYYYTTSGAALCANNQKLVCRKTDARSITTSYTYDAMDRVTGRSYSNGDASLTYYYDQTSYNGLTITNGKGRRTGMSDGSGQTAWSFDKMGRIVAEERTISSITKTMSYGYNVDGSLASITYPSGRVVNYTYGNDARPVSAVDSANSINYATSATYAPPGEFASMVNGEVSGGFAGITRDASYNNRLFPTALSASSSNGTALSLSYTYFANGNVNVETNGRDNGRTATYTYDALNRVISGSSQATSGSDCWGQSFAYDRYANLTTTSSTQCTAPILNLSVNTNNQITSSGFSYDASGDLTGDGVNSYSWNAEAHLKSAASVTYTYDGDLRRVEKSNGTLYWYCASCGKVLAESDLSGNIISEYTFFNDRRIARRDVSSGNVYYIFTDRLGSYRTLTDSSGNVKGESDYYPFGAERVISSTVTDNFRFTGMEWDSEDGLNHTLYRQYTSAQGRWETPDPKRCCVMFPQGQNLYAYVKDDPTNLIDLLGDDPISGACGGTAWESNAACSGPGGYGGGGDGGGGGGGGVPDCPQSCCDIFTFSSAECTNCAPNCLGDGGGGGGNGGGGGPPQNPPQMPPVVGISQCEGCLGKCLSHYASFQLEPCLKFCVLLGVPQAVKVCVEGCLVTYAGEAALCGAAYAICYTSVLSSGSPVWPSRVPPGHCP